MSINNDDQKKSSFDILKWILVAFFLIIIIVGNYYFQQYNFILRIVSIIIVGSFACSIALWTTKGKATLAFIREARFEIRKVIWPTYQETLQTTLIVVVVTTIMSLILLGLDSILVYLVSFITDLRF